MTKKLTHKSDTFICVSYRWRLHTMALATLAGYIRVWQWRPQTCFLKTVWPWTWRTPLAFHLAVLVYIVAVMVCGRHGIIIIIIITTTMFMVLSSCLEHCESWPGSFDECSNSARWPPTFGPSRPTDVLYIAFVCYSVTVHVCLPCTLHTVNKLWC